MRIVFNPNRTGMSRVVVNIPNNVEGEESYTFGKQSTRERVNTRVNKALIEVRKYLYTVQPNSENVTVTIHGVGKIQPLEVDAIPGEPPTQMNNRVNHIATQIKKHIWKVNHHETSNK